MTEWLVIWKDNAVEVEADTAIEAVEKAVPNVSPEDARNSSIASVYPLAGEAEHFYVHAELTWTKEGE